MSSGVGVKDECKAAFNDIKLSKTCQYLVFKLDDGMKNIVIEKRGDKGADYQEFVSHLKSVEENKECRYGIFDMPYEVRGQKNNKLVFFQWSPDTAPIKQKMVYSASVDALKKALGDGIAVVVQANDEDALAQDEIVDRLAKK